MSFSLDSNLFQGTMSRAGKAAAEKFNILNQISYLKDKNQLDDIFIKETNINDYLSKEREGKKESDKANNSNLKTKLNVRKYFQDYVRQYKNKESMINKAFKKRNNSKEKLTLNKSDHSKMSKQSLILDYSKLEKTKLNLINKGTLSPFRNKIKYKFYNIHLKKIKESKKNNEKKQKKEAIYKPNLEYIYNKSSSGPEWKIISGRKEKLFENSGNLLDIFYNYKTTTFYETKKSFINMSKQTNRKDLINDKKLKNKNQSKFSLNRRSLKSISDKKSNFSSTVPISSKFLNSFSLNVTKKKLSLKSRRLSVINKINKPITPLSKTCKSVPDFKRTLGRFAESKHNNKLKASNEGIYYPNYDSIKERSKSMVLYPQCNKKEKEKKNKNYNDCKFKGIVSNDLFNASDAFDKFHTNKLASTPRFDRMISRPQRNNLPSFMQGLYNRLGADSYTEKSLQLNNYSNGDNYIDIYKNDLSIAKQKQSEYDFSFLWDENNKEIEDNKINVLEEEKKTIKMKIELNKIISRMNRMYNNYINNEKY